MNNRIYRPTLVAVAVVLGFLVAVAFNTTSKFVISRPQRVSDLVSVVRDMEQQQTALQGRYSDLRDRMDVLEREAAEDSGVRESFSKELERVRLAAGLTAVAGPGVEVLLGDGRDVDPDVDPNDYLIHDTDITAVVNALIVGGAEAVEVNGERIVATTPIRCAGTTVLVNSARLGSPYTIRAIGEPERLEEAVLNDPMAALVFGPYKAQFGLEVSIADVDDVFVSAYRGSMRPRFAASIKGGDR
ncbi:MAG: DUF881 domain-containing protein [Coriobacteriia bacterium]|nr:DUF881 domain-containing protein [Coriobacteriia bacterium]